MLRGQDFPRPPHRQPTAGNAACHHVTRSLCESDLSRNGSFVSEYVLENNNLSLNNHSLTLPSTLPTAVCPLH